jgi:hypothetical protein
MLVTSAVFIRLVARLEAVDVPLAQLDVAVEHRQEELEVRRGLGLEPDRHRFSRGTGHLAAQVGRHAHRLLVVAAGDANRRRVDGVRVERRLDRRELVEEPSDLRVDQPLVRQALHELGVVGAVRSPGRRHSRALVPVEEPAERVQRLDVREP